MFYFKGGVLSGAMSNFVQVQLDHQSDVDYFNRDHIVRVQAESLATDNWVVKVLVVTGLEVVDSRHADKSAAAARVAQLLN